MKYQKGSLNIVASPIGNLGDFSSRAKEVLSQVDLIASEDTRHSRILLGQFSITTPITSYFEYSAKKTEDFLISKLMSGKNIAIITDAGTPTVSDPGARLVARARKEGIEVIPIPGASAAIAALSVSGMPTQPFHFWGFFPPTKSKRFRIYKQICDLDGTHCFFESKHKITKHVEEWKEVFSDFYFMIGREMTKQFETYHWGRAPQVLDEVMQSDLRGEFTVVLSRELMD
ncbi:MAG: 16S rRNA (cytidine(1402)-2'-O)-methyltransferase [Deltaproteobacteria bacterium RIFCSPLOWO2_12_FULL_40_28]|nr:MAG: 16S rRNA (cytidine(1402)-2'-O)-methyltransferase [Deltaproteobacteria bacterium RIFCSPHIGHO2_02_FULL_40_28]OGQ20348.1 MAG: 16S rRNA (cytidine(1402)-2'-O)-methyltransferase [Deltaproteobacteria bacterium RIFCSPHIGHO2_12_FULL_40_32]OGQ41317.1 MAG: 16S rRNA (cytidine(1402)-2'-O)-methyltransferase [Deltaproteobacteria bacterium RIFCSPLOWO2_02_FULL_40_36]OGQ54956.1 MAG: 16S rRNA (cytidine(1402)-2'-O)-methyltransferase [Deltaproteobacteria bacterium RIFCSPLOWO2_12_FULL_40_28]